MVFRDMLCSTSTTDLIDPFAPRLAKPFLQYCLYKKLFHHNFIFALQLVRNQVLKDQVRYTPEKASLFALVWFYCLVIWHPLACEMSRFSFR
jgi:hypothetical protein